MKLVPFGSICKLQNGRAFKPSDWSEKGDPIVRIQNLNDESKPFNYCNFSVEERFHINTGDLLFSWSGTPGTSFGAFFWNRGFGVLNQHIFRVDVDENMISKDYLRYAINAQLNYIIDQAHGGVGLKHITKGKLEAVEIPLPPLAEQKRIAAILDKADAIRRKRKQAIQLADDFLRSVFLDMFGDPVTNPKDWEVKAIKELATVTTGNTPSRKVPEYFGNDVEWIKSDNINTPHHILTTATEYLSHEGVKVARTVPKGSTLITCIAGSFDCIGNAAFTDREVSFNQQINALTPKSDIVLSWFLYALVLFSKKVIQKASTNSMKGMVSKGKLEEVELILPPIEKQREFEFMFDKQVLMVERMNCSYESSSDNFNSLSQKAFTGEL
ncbi:restriction endonuclease subunit S [Shewanella baltica]|uniref:restriction endonuclease subunit S n=1 Tax=Shewanella baltica TaxID=62322 RepID=UPI00217E8372|nr:restriction endonuclease subunit S [Shewanella baltica]MCS6153579.1 restriction endonuclease subunit S [Shewanella baltica]